MTAEAGTGSVGERIRQRREALGLSQSELGRRVGVSRAAVSQWESDAGTRPSTSHLLAAARVLGVTLNYLGGWDEEPRKNSQFYEKLTRKVIIEGELNAGVFYDPQEYTYDDREAVPIDDEPRFYGVTLRAARVRGPSMNRRFPDGSIVVFTEHDPVHDPLPLDRRVIVRRRRPTGLIEMTVKELRRDSQGSYWLWPLSDHPQHQQPIPLIPDDGDDSIEIVGVVQKAIIND